MANSSAVKSASSRVNRGIARSQAEHILEINVSDQATRGVFADDCFLGFVDQPGQRKAARTQAVYLLWRVRWKKIAESFRMRNAPLCT